MFAIRASLFALLAAVAAGPAYGQGVGAYGKAVRAEPEPEMLGRAAIDQKLGEKLPLDLTFHDHLRTGVTLGDALGGKPALLVLAYYSCPKLCTEVLNGLVDEMKKLRRGGFVAGQDYNVVTVSINPKDDPSFGFKKRRSYLDELDGRPNDQAGWAFLTAGHGQGTDVPAAYATIRTLADAVGFRYVADNQRKYDEVELADEAQRPAKLAKAINGTKDYVHPSCVMVVTPDGKLSRYFLGLAPNDYAAKDLKFALMEAGGGKIGSFTDKMALLCYAYDPHSGTYRPVMRIMGAVAAPFPLIVGAIVYFAWRRSKREKLMMAAATAAVNSPPAVPVSD